MGEVTFKGLNSTSKNVSKPKQISKIQGKDVITITVEGVELTYLLVDNINYDSITSLEDVLELEKSQNILVDIQPKLYSRFLDKQKNLRTFVSKGDIVEPNEVKNGKRNGPGFVLSSFNLNGKVDKVRFSKLDDMTIIVADINGESVLSYYLRKVENNG